MGKIVVIGSSNTDMVVTSYKIPKPGETVLGNDFEIIQGGKGANQAVAAARAGAEVSFVAKVGNDDFGRKAIEGYKKDNIDTSKIFIDNATSTGVALITVDETNGQNSIDIITPNETEAEFLTGIKPDDIYTAGKAASILLNGVNEAVLITMGHKGIYYASKTGDNLLIPGNKVHAIDSTAAGDVFNGYFAASLVQGKSFQDAILLANKDATISVTRKGAQSSIPYFDEL